MGSDELDDIDELEASAERMMQEPSPAPSRNRSGSGKNKPADGAKDGAIEKLLMEIRDRLDRLLQAQPHDAALTPEQEAVEEQAEKPSVPGIPAPKTDSAINNPQDNAITASSTKLVIDDSAMMAAVQEHVTRHALTHHSSVVLLLGWAFALLSSGIGMVYGFIAGSGRYPYWIAGPKAGVFGEIVSAFLGAPVGIVLLPLGGAILWASSRESESEKRQMVLRSAGILVFLCGVLLPLISVL
ncbi:MAG: hypothetical protein AB7T01_02255 [Acidithiobacillus sp.]